MRILIPACLAVSLLFSACSPPSDNATAVQAAEEGFSDSDTLHYENISEWVSRLKIPAPDPEDPLANAPARLLLADAQSIYRKTVKESYAETAIYISDPMGLALAGNLAAQWQPSMERLAIHHVHILRDDKIIDVVKNDQAFTVLRREQNLESSFVDGVKTASLQVEGLKVGDIVNFAYSIKAKMPLKGVTLGAVIPRISATRSQKARIRQVWPKGSEVEWQTSDDLEPPVLSESKFGEELVLNLNTLKKENDLVAAPARYHFTHMLEVSTTKDWSKISNAYSPHFDMASKISKGSELYDEAQKIAAETDDPAARAEKALQLVQEQVRYLFVGLNSGAYLPDSAEKVWAQRFGDCKGKTALLIALLQHLDITAEPVLVSTIYGDGMDARLPNIELFDHVIVRADVDGRSYWLDGTTTNDRSLSRVQVPHYTWGLPLRQGRTSLVEIKPAVPDYLMKELKLTIDAAKGFRGDMPLKGQMIVRGNGAKGIWQVSNSMTPEQIDKAYKSLWKSLGKIDADTTTTTFDETTGDATINMTGTIKFSHRKQLPWSYFKVPLYAFSDDLYFLNSVKTDETRDAPWKLGYPYTGHTRVEIKVSPNTQLPIIDGPPVEGETRIVKSSWTYKLEELPLKYQSNNIVLDGIVKFDEGTDLTVIMDKTTRILSSEMPDEEARELAEVITDYEASPADRFYYIDDGTIADENNSESELTASDYISRGYDYAERGMHKLAIADFDSALNLDENSARAWANRGLSEVHLKNYTEAKRNLNKAISINPKDWVTYNGLGLLHEVQNDCASALRYFKQTLQHNRSNEFAKYHRIGCLVQVNDFEGAREELSQYAKELALGAPIDNMNEYIDTEEAKYLKVKDGVKKSINDNIKLDLPKIKMVPSKN